jgi:hypothetical protein
MRQAIPRLALRTVTVKDKFAPVVDCDTLKNIVADLTTNDCRLSASAVPLSVPQSIDNCGAKIAGVLSPVPTTSYPMGDTILPGISRMRQAIPRLALRR